VGNNFLFVISSLLTDSIFGSSHREYWTELAASAVALIVEAEQAIP
jgi:hypothetical protein